ncbi:Marine sediment metagenome DNA, contig: S01H1_S03621 (Fragment) OS=marine sediment metagenome GN=S01H1_29933 PE=4 SV=1 [Gemmata massiliana]|uniref:Marine sediment metagenome DNA, contig: S01H1_S03621 n=1 Tax=Gemmata massiliana TaxID=1210884 RepID=A0A6P2D9I0_9BACT
MYQALEGVPLSQLEGGFNARQQRLTGVNDDRAFDPAFLGQQLTRTRAQIGEAVDRQQSAFERPDGVKSGAFTAAAEEVLRLKTNASNLQQALKNLADTSERSAVLQEKLNRLKQEEDGRLGLAERFATADPAEQLRLNRSVVLANDAANKGNLDSFGNEDRRQILDFLNSARGVTLTGFKGSPRAEDLKNSLLANSFGGQFQLNRDQKAENASVRGTILERNKTGEAAQSELIKFQETGTKELLSGLNAQQNVFFARLERLLLANKATDVQNRIAAVESQKGALLDKSPSRDLLAQLGITKTSQIEVLGKNTGKIESLRGAIATEQAQYAQIDAAREGIKGVRFDQDDNRFVAAISRSGLKEEQVNRVQKRAEGLYEFNDSFRAKLSGVTETTARGSKERNDGYNDVLRQAYEQALREEKARDISGPVQEARSKLAGIEGVDPLKIEETLRDPKKADPFLKALGSFDSGSNKIEDFGKKVEAANAELDKLKAQLAEINATSKIASGTVTRAQGGSIFRPMGTDTVPAMLTPGEFVINARSASANSALLQRINAARGPVAYRAGGGFVGQTPETIAEETMREIEERRIASEKFVRDRNIKKQFAASGAAKNPFNRAAQVLAEIRGGSTAAGRLAVTAQATNFNRLSSLGSGIRRPGDDGQLAIASRVIGVEQKGLEERFSNDNVLRKFVAEQLSPKKKVRKFASGGYVGHAGVGDTVPALLTGGEFVLNQAVVSRMGPHNVQRFNDGGPVGGNFVAPGAAAVNREQERRQGAGLSEGTVNRLSSSLTFAQQVGGFSESADQLSRTLNSFAGSARNLSQALNNMPRTLTGQFNHNVVVTHNGAEVFSKLTPAIEQMVTERVNSTMTRVFKEHLPDAGVRI